MMMSDSDYMDMLRHLINCHIIILLLLYQWWWILTTLWRGKIRLNKT